jgi:hypothetical protein
MKKTEERIIAEKVLESIRRKHYKGRNSKAYIKQLEKLLVTVSEALFITTKQQEQSFKDLQQTVPALSKSIPEFIVATMEIVTSSIEDKIKRKKLEAEILKYRGRKVSQENLDLYKEVIQTDKERIAEGEDSNYSKSVEKVGKKHHFSERKQHQVYKSFNYWFNNPQNKALISRLLS